MIYGYAEFREVMNEFCRETYGVIPHDVDAESRCEALWERLSLRDYVEKLYILSREDVRMIAEQDDIELDEENLSDQFWADLQKYVESSMGGWDETIREALTMAMAMEAENERGDST